MPDKGVRYLSSLLMLILLTTPLFGDFIDDLSSGARIKSGVDSKPVTPYREHGVRPPSVSESSEDTSADTFGEEPVPVKRLEIQVPPDTAPSVLNATPLTPKDNIRLNVSVEQDMVPINEKFTVKMVLVSKWRTSSVSFSVLKPPDLAWAYRVGQFSRNYITSEGGETLFVYQVSYEYRAREEGEFKIPPIPVRVTNPQTNEKFEIESDELNVKVFRNVKDMQKQGYDYKKPEKPSPVKNICLYTILILVLLIVTLVLLIILKTARKRGGKQSPTFAKKVNDREYYLLKLEELIKESSDSEVKGTVLKSDELIRKWLSLNFGFEALELLPREIIDELKEKKNITDDYLSRLEYFFDVVDKIKYANQTLNDSQFSDFAVRAKDIINKTP